LGWALWQDGKFLAVALLDNTVKVFFADTLKFFLSLYGHKLPVMSLDISSDSTMLISGSADKNVKIWGLDFGDCHKSLLAHEDSVMSVRGVMIHAMQCSVACGPSSLWTVAGLLQLTAWPMGVVGRGQVQFVPNTHYFFSCGKDKTIKYWDADKFEHIFTLDAHHAEVWTLALSSQGTRQDVLLFSLHLSESDRGFILTKNPPPLDRLVSIGSTRSRPFPGHGFP
jgi:U3 small nucleolar RNA-associated protein 12